MTATILALLLAFSSTLGGSFATPEHVDRIELNHICDADDPECILLTQVIVWGWNAEHRRLDVRAFFTLAEGDAEPYPVGRGRWQYRYRNFGKSYVVESDEFVETTTVRDPEQANRRLCPYEFRVPLVGQAVPRSLRESGTSN